MEASLAPPRTVKSSPPTTTRRPSMRPVPITKFAGRMEASVSPSYFATPARAPVSWNESRSSRRSIRSRTVRRPALCWRSTFSAPPIARASSWRRLSSSTSGSQDTTSPMIPSSRGFGQDRQMVVGRARVQDAQPRGRRLRRRQGRRQRPGRQAGQGGASGRLYKGHATPGAPAGPEGRRPRRAPGRGRPRPPALRRPHAARAAAPALGVAALPAAGRRPSDQARAPRARPPPRVVKSKRYHGGPEERDDHGDLRLDGDRRGTEPLSPSALHSHRHEALRDGGGDGGDPEDPPAEGPAYHRPDRGAGASARLDGRHHDGGPDRRTMRRRDRPASARRRVAVGDRKSTRLNSSHT